MLCYTVLCDIVLYTAAERQNIPLWILNDGDGGLDCCCFLVGGWSRRDEPGLALESPGVILSEMRRSRPLLLAARTLQYIVMVMELLCRSASRGSYSHRSKEMSMLCAVSRVAASRRQKQ